MLTGPPFSRSRDEQMAMMAVSTRGRKVICGGTTSNIISRRLNRTLLNDMNQPRDVKVPPYSRMEGFELVTEGALTLSAALRLFEEVFAPQGSNANAAARLVALLLDSDIVNFAVGTSVNEAHQDPNFPVELDLRRNIVKCMAKVLESKYMKRAIIQYF